MGEPGSARRQGYSQCWGTHGTPRLPLWTDGRAGAKAWKWRGLNPLLDKWDHALWQEHWRHSKMPKSMEGATRRRTRMTVCYL